MAKRGTTGATRLLSATLGVGGSGAAVCQQRSRSSSSRCPLLIAGGVRLGAGAGRGALITGAAPEFFNRRISS